MDLVNIGFKWEMILLIVKCRNYGWCLLFFVLLIFWFGKWGDGRIKCDGYGFDKLIYD